jgi:hypothetical protein
MKIALDSSIIFTLLKGQPGAEFISNNFDAWKRDPLTQILICEMVVAEISPWFPTPNLFQTFLHDLEIEFDPITLCAATAAGRIHRRYRKEGGSRERMVPDFLVAAHASVQADALATLDRGFYRRYFPDLRLLGPGDSLER